MKSNVPHTVTYKNEIPVHSSSKFCLGVVLTPVLKVTQSADEKKIYKHRWISKQTTTVRTNCDFQQMLIILSCSHQTAWRYVNSVSIQN